MKKLFCHGPPRQFSLGSIHCLRVSRNIFCRCLVNRCNLPYALWDMYLVFRAFCLLYSTQNRIVSSFFGAKTMGAIHSVGVSSMSFCLIDLSIWTFFKPFRFRAHIIRRQEDGLKLVMWQFVMVFGNIFATKMAISSFLKFKLHFHEFVAVLWVLFWYLDLFMPVLNVLWVGFIKDVMQLNMIITRFLRLKTYCRELYLKKCL